MQGVCSSALLRAMDFKNQIIGVMRFSYPAKDGFARSLWPEEKLEAHLFDHDRMMMRFRYLEAITLPSLIGQTDKDFKLVILAGQSMQPRFKNRLREIGAQHDFIKCLFFPSMGGAGSSKRAFRRAIDEGTTHVTGFRIDDDDAVACDYIAKTRALADKVIAGGLADRPYAIAFSKGVYWDLNDPDEPFHEFREPQPLGLACAMITTAEMETSIYRYNHRRLCCHVPTYMDPDDFMFMRTLHQTNDSGRKIPPHAVKLPADKGLRLMEKRFSINVPEAMALMPEPPA